MERFTFDYYEKLLETLKDNDYDFVFFDDSEKIKKKGKKIVLLRHDIDFDVNQAEKISEIEKKHDIKSTYFFLLNSKSYNIHNSETYEIIKKILNEGHEIGIHFDEASYDYSTNSELKNFVEKEIGFFESLFNKEIKIISFHRPTDNILLDKIDIPIAHTYEDRYAKDVKYLSDSKKQFREGNLIDIINSNKYDKLQILLHPIWWNKENRVAQKDYESFIDQKIVELKKEIDKNSSIFQYEGNND